MPRPVHFEIPAENPQRAMQFYETLFGWKFQKWDGPMDYWIITTGQPGEPGIDGGLAVMHLHGCASVTDPAGWSQGVFRRRGPCYERPRVDPPARGGLIL